MCAFWCHPPLCMHLSVSWKGTRVCGRKKAVSDLERGRTDFSLWVERGLPRAEPSSSWPLCAVFYSTVRGSVGNWTQGLHCYSCLVAQPFLGYAMPAKLPSPGS